MTGLLRRVMVLLDWGTRRKLLLAVVGSIVISGAEILAVLAMLPLMQLIARTDAASGSLETVSRLLGDPPTGRLATYIAGFVILGFILKGLVALGVRWWTLGFINDQSIRTSAELMRYYLTAPMSLHKLRGAPDLLRTMNDAVSQVYNQILVGFMSAMTEFITIVALGLTLFYVNPIPTAAIAAYFGISAFVLQRSVRRKTVKAGEQLIHAAYVTTQTSLHALGGIKEIKLRNEQEVFVAKYSEARGEAAKAVRTSTFLADLPKYVIEILFIGGIGLMTVLIYAREPSTAALSSLALFAAAGFRIMPSITRLLAALNVIRGGSAALDLVEKDVTAARSHRAAARVRSRAVPLTQQLELEDVSFHYDDSDQIVLDGIDLVVPAGTSLAIVGGSGAGKSTLVDIILGLHPPTSGRVLADGVDINEHLVAWQENLSMVPQEVYLLDESLRENIWFSPEVDDPGDRRLTKAVEDAQLTALIEGLPQGLDTFVGDRGSRLSGGQRQRVGIARALFRDPALLVLDEATSSLDNETERQITDTIDALQGRITLIVVAHRLSTVRRCDKIAFLKDGHVAALGTFDELQLIDGDFAHLVELGSLAPLAQKGPAR